MPNPLRPEDLRACLAHPRTTINTAAGPMEYADRGSGEPLLAVHGTLGGCDQGLVATEFFRANGFRIIAPSRPGYLGTPLATGRTPSEQADALAALMDALSIGKIAVFAGSGGGPAAYALAARHHFQHRGCCAAEQPQLESTGFPLARRTNHALHSPYPAHGPSYPKAIADTLGLSQGYISNRLAQLSSFGFVDTEKTGRHIIYSLTIEGEQSLQAHEAGGGKPPATTGGAPGVSMPPPGVPCPACGGFIRTGI